MTEPTPAPPAPVVPPVKKSPLAIVKALYAFATSPSGIAKIHRLVTAALAVYVAVHRAGV